MVKSMLLRARTHREDIMVMASTIIAYLGFTALAAA